MREEARGSTSRVCTCLLPEHGAEVTVSSRGALSPRPSRTCRDASHIQSSPAPDSASWPVSSAHPSSRDPGDLGHSLEDDFPWWHVPRVTTRTASIVLLQRGDPLRLPPQGCWQTPCLPSPSLSPLSPPPTLNSLCGPGNQSALQRTSWSSGTLSLQRNQLRGKPCLVQLPTPSPKWFPSSHNHTNSAVPALQHGNGGRGLHLSLVF